NLPQALRLRREHKPGGKKSHSCDEDPPRAKAVRERSGHHGDAEIQESAQREEQRDSAARGTELTLQRREKRCKSIGEAKADEGDDEGGGHHGPAVKPAITRHRDQSFSQTSAWTS